MGGEQQVGRVVTFGEAMLRLTPPGHERLERTAHLDLTVGGAELNTAVALRCLDVPSTWVSCLPENALGRLIARQARAAGVDTSAVRWVPESEGRLGLYFLEEGGDPRPSAVTYDRAGSAFARMSPGAFDWPALLERAAAFHVSGITPAVSASARAETFVAVRAANAAGVPVAFDLNYRSKLWSEAAARDCFADLAPLADILFASREGLRTFFGIEGDDAAILRAAREQFGLSVAILARKHATNSREIALSATAVGPDNAPATTGWRGVEIVDRLGGGDAFAAGFLAGYLTPPANLARALALGIAASALKHTMPGDFLAATRTEIEAAMMEGASGALQR